MYKTITEKGTDTGMLQLENKKTDISTGKHKNQWTIASQHVKVTHLDDFFFMKRNVIKIKAEMPTSVDVTLGSRHIHVNEH